MSLAEKAASEKFINAMGPMVADESMVQKVMLFIEFMRTGNQELPQMSFQELNECIPLDEAFNQLRENVHQSYNKTR